MGRRLGVMGGTFDPIHYGHLVTAEEALEQFELEGVLFVPTGRPWMKEHEVVSPPEDRYLMTVIATASNPLFSVSRVEVDRDGPTYTVETLRSLPALNSDYRDTAEVIVHKDLRLHFDGNRYCVPPRWSAELSAVACTPSPSLDPSTTLTSCTPPSSNCGIAAASTGASTASAA